MKERGFTLSGVSDRLGMRSNRTVHRVMNGDGDARLSTLVDTATALGKRLKIELIDDTDTRS